jgi:hypothetical protein
MSNPRRIYINLDKVASEDGEPAAMNLSASSEIFNTSDFRRIRIALEKGSIPTGTIPVCRFADIKDISFGYLKNGGGAKTISTSVGAAVNKADSEEIFSVAAIITMFNTTLKHLFTLSDPQDFTSAEKLPQLIFTPDTKDIAFNVSAEFADGFKLLGDSNAHTLLLAGFDTSRYAGWYVLALKEGRTSQEFPTYPNFFQNDTILVSSDLPCVQEHVGFGGHPSSYRSVLTDINIRNTALRSDVSLVPNYQRWIDMQRGVSVYSINLTIYFRDKNGEVYPLKLLKGSHLSFKICVSFDENV